MTEIGANDLLQQALEFKKWAASEGLLAITPPREDIAQLDEEEFEAAIEGAGHDPAVAKEIFQRRKIRSIGINDKENAIIVLTHQKLTKKDLERIPRETERGAKIKYIKATEAVAMPPAGDCSGQAHTIKLHGRFACGGSISLANQISMGTLGALVRDERGDIFGLTCNHVTGDGGYAPRDFPIVAPGLLDVRPNWIDPETIGYHARTLDLVQGTPENSQNVNRNIDAALFRIKDPAMVSSSQGGHYDTPSMMLTDPVNYQVCKYGAATGLTIGTVIGRVAGHEAILYKFSQLHGFIYFPNLLMVKANNGAFAKQGDSGALVCYVDGGSAMAVGLVIGVSKDASVTYVQPIKPVLEGFGVRLLSGHHSP